MPAVWGEDEFHAGGLKGISKFNGKAKEFEEDVDGKYSLQVALYFEDVEVLESTDEVVLEDGDYTDWIKQSNKTGSVNEQFALHIRDFIRANKLKGGVPNAIYGHMITWERQEVTEASDDGKMSAGLCLVPVALVDEEPPVKTTKTTKATKASAPPAEEYDDEPDENDGPHAELVAFITKCIGDDGATRDLVRREVAKKTPMRNHMKAFGDGKFDSVIDALLESETLVEDDGTLVVAST